MLYLPEQSMMLSQTENCNLVFKSTELLCLTFLTVFLTLTLVLYLIQMMTTWLSFEKCLILNLRHFKAILFSEMGCQHLVKVGLAALSPLGHLESQISKITLSFECVFQSSDMCGIWLLRNSVNIILCLTNAIRFIIAVTKIVANGHELWRLANRKMLSGVKKLVKAMMGKGVPLPEWCLKNFRRKEPFAAKEKEKDRISRK